MKPEDKISGHQKEENTKGQSIKATPPAMWDNLRLTWCGIFPVSYMRFAKYMPVIIPPANRTAYGNSLSIVFLALLYLVENVADGQILHVFRQ